MIFFTYLCEKNNLKIQLDFFIVDDLHHINLMNILLNYVDFCQ